MNDNLVPIKVALLSGSTIGEIKPVLELFLLNLGLKPEFYEGGYGLFYENTVFDDGSLAAFAPDVLYIHTSARNLRFWPSPAQSVADAAQNLADEYTHFEKVWQAAARYGCPIIQNNFEEPLWRNFGNLDAQDMRGRVRYVRLLNEKLAQYAEATPNFYIHDFAYLAAIHGLDAFCDNAAWYAYKYACAPAFIPQLCHSLAAQIGALLGRGKKGVVTDLDNTLWGGVVGEVGAERLELGSETPAGMAYAELGQYLGMLASRGILLSVASKNEEAAAESGLARTDSPLSREDFLCFEANWNPKSQSVAGIAKTLNIGVDSLVFIDDNPAEREEVARALPFVATPPIAQPEDSVRLLDRAGYFEATALSGDDVARTKMYRENAQRRQTEESFADYDDYLRSLSMKAAIGAFSPDALERITQLINKTNQFNLTTHRYTQSEVESIAQNPQYITLSGRLTDKFGDNGITSAIIAKLEGQVLDIELWIMSCRVFKRQLEHAMFDMLVKQAQTHGATVITGRYLPTAKNLLVRDFYATIGFDIVEDTAEKREFRFEIPAGYTPKNTVIEVEETNG